MYGGLLAALIIALVVTIIAVLGGRRGPWGSAWTFFLIVFLALWIVSLYIRTVGPVYFGIAWLPMIIAGLLLAVLLALAIPDANHWRDESIQSETPQEISQKPSTPGPAITRFFWVLIVFMILAIIVGMCNPRPAL